MPIYIEIKNDDHLTYIRHPEVLSSFCILHYLIPTYINLKSYLRRGDVTVPFTSLFAWSPRFYLCTRLVSNVTTPVGWIFIQSWITGRASLGVNYLTRWSSSGPWYNRKEETVRSKYYHIRKWHKSHRCCPVNTFVNKPVSSFIHIHFRLLRCQPQPPRTLHGNWLHYAYSVG